MEKNVGLSFDATIKAEDAKKNLRVPIIRKKSNTKIDKTKNIGGTESALNSLVSVEDLMIDMSYQRFPNENKVNDIVKNFDPDAIGVLICSAREDGTIAVIDGGHRVAALRMLGFEKMNVDCLVYFDLTIAEEAKIFNLMNDNRTKPKTQDRFKAKVTSNDTNAVELNDIFKTVGLEVATKPMNNGIRAIGTVENVFKKHGADVTLKALTLLKEAFGSHSSSFSDVAIVAVANVLSTYKDVDLNRLSNALKVQVNASLWASNGAVLANQIRAKQTAIGMSILLIKDYNKKMRVNRLDEKMIW